MLVIDLDSMKMRQFVVWQKNLSLAIANNDYDKLFDCLSKVVTAWDYSEASPNDVNTYYDELTVKDWRKLMVEMQEVTNNSFSG